eukprot:COSAG02_NODE_4310_length_5526_cov_2.555187_5_plen_117_part_00
MASPTSGAGNAAPAASGGARSADHIAWEQSVKDAAANGGHKPDEHGEYRCRCETRTVRAELGSMLGGVACFQTDDCLLNLTLTQVSGLQPRIFIARRAAHPHRMAQTQRKHLCRCV